MHGSEPPPDSDFGRFRAVLDYSFSWKGRAVGGQEEAIATIKEVAINHFFEIIAFIVRHVG